MSVEGGTLKRTCGLAALLTAFVALFSMCLGMTFIKTMGPLTFPDSARHVNEIYVLATGQEFAPASPYVDKYGNEFSVQYASIDTRILNAPYNASTLISALIQLPESKDPLYAKQRAALSKTDDPQRQTVRRNSNTHFTSYAIPGAAFACFSASDSSIWRGLQAGRLANLIVHTIIICFALHALPKGKLLFAFIATLPTTIFLASSLSSDALLFALMALCVAKTCQALHVGHMTMPNALICAVAAILAFLNKTPYGLIAIMLLALPAQVLSKEDKIKVSIAAIIVALCLWLPWRMKVSSVACCVNLGTNYAWMARHLLRVVYLVIASACGIPYLIYNAPSRYAIESVLILMAVLLAVQGGRPRQGSFTYCDPRQEDLRQGGPRHERMRQEDSIRALLYEWRMPIIGFVIGFCVIAMTFLLLGITWNDMTAVSLWRPLAGFQVRYLVPLLPFVLLVYYPASRIGDGAVAEESITTERDSCE